LRIALFCGIIVCTARCLSQTTDTDHKTDTLDVTDVLKKVFTRNSYVKSTIPNNGQKRIFLSVLPDVEYSLATGVTAGGKMNISFFSNKSPNANLSTITATAMYSQYNQFSAFVISNIWGKKSDLDFQGDWRFNIFPTYTYGLGGYTLASDKDLVDYSSIRIYQTVLKPIYKDWHFGLGYNLDYYWNITDGSPAGKLLSSVTDYHVTPQSVASGISANLLYDTRRNPNNPKNGSYASVVYRPNFTFLGSDENWQSLLIDLRKYVQLPFWPNNVLAFWTYNYFTLKGDPPYFNLPNSGSDTYNNLGRGYALGRYRSKNLVSAETEYRFGLTRNKLLGGVVFANVQSVSEWPSNKFEKLLPGYGCGLRIKINKDSDTNLAVDYGWGIDGSRGFFFNLGEVF